MALLNKLSCQVVWRSRKGEVDSLSVKLNGVHGDIHMRIVPLFTLTHSLLKRIDSEIDLREENTEEGDIEDGRTVGSPSSTGLSLPVIAFKVVCNSGPSFYLSIHRYPSMFSRSLQRSLLKFVHPFDSNVSEWMEDSEVVHEQR